MATLLPTLRTILHTTYSTWRSTYKPTPKPHPRLFSASRPQPAKNRIYTPIRNTTDFDTYMLLSSSSNQPLITLWTASWCSSCAAIKPLLRHLIETDRVGEGLPAAEGGTTSVAFAEVELDSPDVAEVAARFQITSVPMLLAFSRREPQVETRVTSVEKMKDRRFLVEWIENEARRGGGGGAGGSLFGGLFGRVLGGGSS